jgi:hypothetical protein
MVGYAGSADTKESGSASAIVASKAIVIEEDMLATMEL